MNYKVTYFFDISKFNLLACCTSNIIAHRKIRSEYVRTFEALAKEGVAITDHDVSLRLLQERRTCTDGGYMRGFLRQFSERGRS